MARPAETPQRTLGDLQALLTRYRQLEAEYRVKAEAIEEAIAVIEAGAPRPPAALRKAIALDRARRWGQVAKRRPGRPRTRPDGKRWAPPAGYFDKATTRERRTRSAALLEHFNATEPLPPPPGIKWLAVNAMIRNGYLRKDGAGYLRTDKTFSVEEERRR